MSIFETIINHFNGQVDAISGHTEAVTPYIAEAAHLFAHTLLEGHKILCCGASSSHSVAQHFCSELLSLNAHRPSLPCIVLGGTQNIAAAVDNDEPNDYLARQINALGNSGDTLVLFSISGQEKCLIRAIETANNRQLSMVIINSGNSDIALNATGNCVSLSLRNLPRIQALNLQFLTATLLADLIEQLLFGNLE